MDVLFWGLILLGAVVGGVAFVALAGTVGLAAGSLGATIAYACGGMLVGGLLGASTGVHLGIAPGQRKAGMSEQRSAQEIAAMRVIDFSIDGDDLVVKDASGKLERISQLFAKSDPAYFREQIKELAPTGSNKGSVPLKIHFSDNVPAALQETVVEELRALDLKVQRETGK